MGGGLTLGKNSQIIPYLFLTCPPTNTCISLYFVAASKKVSKAQPEHGLEYFPIRDSGFQLPAGLEWPHRERG